MTEKQKFLDFLKKYGFNITNDFTGNMNIMPHHQKTTEGDHVLLREVWATLFRGASTGPGELGCVSLEYVGMRRRKHCRELNRVEMLKKAFCPSNAKEAIATFKKWVEDTSETRKTWQTII